MALTKAQVSLVTVATLGAAPGGFTADLLNFGSQKDVANLIATLGTPEFTTFTNAEFALQVAKNLGVSAGDKAVTKFFDKLEAGTSRADAAVDFANAQLVAQGGKIASVKAATESTSTSTDLSELTKVVSGTTSGLTVKFEDKEKDQTKENVTNETIGNVGKAQIDAGDSKVSADFTFALKNQIGGADTFNGLFLSPILDRQAASSTGSQLFLELLDLRAFADEKAPLERVPVDTFAFSLNGSQILVQSEAIFAAKTYQELFAAIQARVEELGQGVNVPTTNSDGTAADAAAYAKLAGFTVELGSNFTVKNQDGDDVSGTQIVLKDSGGATLTPQGFVNKAGVIPDPGYTLYAQLNNVAPSTVTKLITTNLDADNVGYGSQGASVNLAGQSASNKGVEEIKVLATNGVWFTKLQSQKDTNHLQRVELKSGSEGYFRVGTQENSPNHVVSLVDQDFSKGGLVDVQQVEASAAGETAINSYISENVLNRYDFKDTGIYTADDSKAAITYNLSSGTDVLNLAIDTKVLAAVDTQVNVNTGAGDDVITVMATNGLGLDGKANAAISGTGWLVDQQLNDNIKIDAGAGNDWILTPGAGNATILAGAGNDVVRVDNTGDRGVFVFNNATTDINKLKLNQGLDSNSDNGLSAGVTTTTAQTFDFYKAVVKVTFKGFESKYITIDSTNYTTTTKQINQAIKKAINDDAVLSKLIAAHDNEGNALAIESLIDGTLALTDLDIEIQKPALYSTAQADIDAAKAAGQVMLANGEEAKADAAYLADGKTSTTAGIDTTFAEGLYETEFAASPGTPGSTMASVTGAEDVAGDTEVLEVQTLDLSGVTVAAGQSMIFTIDGADYTYTNGTTGALTGEDLVDALVSDLTVTGYAVTKDTTVDTDLVITQDAGNGSSIAAITTAIGTPGSTTPSVDGSVDTPYAPATPATAETQVIDFSAITLPLTTDGNITIGGVTVALTTTAHTSAALIADAVATALNNETLAAPAPVSGGPVSAVADGEKVEITYPAADGLLIGTVDVDDTDGTGVGAITGTVGTPGTAAVAEQVQVQNLDLTSETVLDGESMIFTIDGQTIDYTNGTGGDLTGAALAADIASTLGTGATVGTAGDYDFTDSGTTLTITQAAGNGSNIDPITTEIGTPGSTVASETGVEDVDGDTEVLEVQTLDLSGVTVAAGQSMIFTIDGTEHTYTNGAGVDLDGEDLVDALVTDLTVTGYAVTKDTTVATDLVITQTAGNGSDIAAITTAIGTPATFIPHNGSNSWAESDNVIDLGTGQDVLVLGTGAESNDTVVFKGYNLGEKTIVNFTTVAVASTTQGEDLLDFSAYLTSVDATTKAVISQGVGTTFADNNVTLVTFGNDNKLTATADALTFDKLTDANVKTLLNSDDASGQINGLNNFTTDATNHVLMLQDGTENVYKAFHVTTGTTASVATDVKLIGTFDFGNNDVSGLATADLA